MAAEDASRRAEEARRTAESERMTREHEAQRLAEERRELEAKRESEARELAAKLSRLREQRSAESASRNDAIDDPAPSGHFVDRWDNKPTADSASTALEDSGPGAPARAPIHETSNETHVTVLLIMEPGNRGIRRFDKSADPVLCLGPRCYVGAGAATPAQEMTRAQALGPANTFGARAAACRHSLGCVFRDVDLGGEEASLQPVDLKIMLHDRREARTVSADDSCEIESGRLYCGDTIRAAGWRAWIVPESLAARAGGELLQAAVAAGLPDVRSAALR